MKNNYIIESASKEEVSFILKRAGECSEEKVPLMKDRKVQRNCKVIKDSDGSVIAGVVGFINHNFKSIFIDLLWVKEEFRRCGYGTILLKHIDKEAFEKEIHFVYLGTLGFQAKDFYIKKGYEVFATLDECVLNNKMYWMKKLLNSENINLEIESKIEDGTHEDVKYIGKRIVDFNKKQIPFTNKLDFENVSKVVKDSKGNIIAGVAADLLPWCDLSIQALWTSKGTMEEELKIELLAAEEKELIEKGGCVAMYETFDSNTVDFFIRNGYEIYGVLEDYPLDYKLYFMKKVLIG
jgi:N-acetylglutamate synthase-like GNAT family acetyltransferase